MGIAVSIIVYLFRYLVVSCIKSITLVFLIMAIAGFSSFAIGESIWLLASDYANFNFSNWIKIIPHSLTVGVLCIIVGLVSNALHTEKWLIESRMNWVWLFYDDLKTA